ncbi:uncharacterized protein EDB91DRAFT_1080986 [Suillus paluster]|uniref:uncharacterized protein n=1 Tax=Suillus paluster TaxID=48578 RepID=UPI001B8824E8|nr:uncharacterized protein EDB91DRAFT_1080986 [Suillus paluster]KAG1743583.1 hypothetical protein EDB91DRAFT_1080986 [Suillus paluster]
MNNPSCPSNDSVLQHLVKEQAGWWTVISRTTQGQEYCWVAINHDQPRVGPPPVQASLRTDKVFNCGVLRDNDWSINNDYWDSSRPYRSYIPIAPHSDRFPAGQWVATSWATGQHWGNLHFDSISYDNLHNLLNDRIPIHYQRYPTDTGAFDLRGLRAYDYDDLQRMKRQSVRGDRNNTKQAIHPVAKRNAMLMASNATPVAGSTKAKAKYYKMNGREKEIISKKLYKCLAKVYFVEHLELPTGDIFIINPDDDNEIGEPVVTQADMAVHLAKMSSAAPDKEASQIFEVIDTNNAPVKTLILAAGRGHLQEVVHPIVTSLQKLTALLSQQNLYIPMHQLPANRPLAITRLVLPPREVLTVNSGHEVVHSTQTQNRTAYQQTSYRGLRRDDEHGPMVHQEDHWHYNRPVAACLEADSSPSSSAPLSSPPRVHEHKWEGPLSSLYCHDTVVDVTSMTRPSARPTTLSAVPNIRPRVPNLPVPIPSDEGLQRMNTAFGANVARFTSPPPHLAGITFPSGAPQQLGRLITTFHTAIRVVYNLFCNPNASPADSIVTLLSLGTSYRIMTPMPAVRSSLAHTAGVYPHIIPQPYLDTCIQYSGMNLKGTDYWHQYLRQFDGWGSGWMQMKKWFQTHLSNLSSGNLAAPKTRKNLETAPSGLLQQ